MAYDTFQLTGTYNTWDGQPEANRPVYIIPSVPLVIDAAGNKILTGRVKVTTDGTGSFDVDLPDPNDTSLNPSGFGYTVAARLSKTNPSAVSFAVPEGTVTLDMADVTTVDPATFNPGVTYAPAADVAAVAADVAAVEGSVTALTATVATKETPAGAQAKADAAEADAVAEAGALVDAEETRAVTAESLNLTTAAAGNIQATVRKLADDTGDVKILVLGDSTSSQAGMWPDVLMPQIRALYPHRSLRQLTWGGSSYGAASVLVAGSGSTNIDFYQGAVTGTVPESVWATMDAQVAAVQPDLVMIAFGTNYGKNAADGGQPNDTTMDYVFRERMTRFVGEVRQLVSNADIMILSQSPDLRASARYQMANIRAQALRSIAADFGLAYGPNLEAYLATGNPTAYLSGDLLHPTTSGATNGSALTATALLPYFRVAPNVAPAARQPSPFVLPGVQLLTNANFAAFASPPTLTGWTASNVTLAKNTTDYESINAYSVRASASVTGSPANASFYQLLPIRRVRGQVVTIAARVFVATGQGSQPGRVQLTDSTGTSVTSGTITNVRDKWIWVSATARIPVAATFATASIIVGAAGPTPTDQCSVDRVSAVLGHYPRDVAA